MPAKAGIQGAALLTMLPAVSLLNGGNILVDIELMIENA